MIMKKSTFFNTVGGIDEKYIEEALMAKKRSPIMFLKIAVPAAACLCIVLSAILFGGKIIPLGEDENTVAAPYFPSDKDIGKTLGTQGDHSDDYSQIYCELVFNGKRYSACSNFVFFQNFDDRIFADEIGEADLTAPEGSCSFTVDDFESVRDKITIPSMNAKLYRLAPLPVTDMRISENYAVGAIFENGIPQIFFNTEYLPSDVGSFMEETRLNCTKMFDELLDYKADFISSLPVNDYETSSKLFDCLFFNCAGIGISAASREEYYKLGTVLRLTYDIYGIAEIRINTETNTAYYYYPAGILKWDIDPEATEYILSLSAKGEKEPYNFID